MKLLLSTVVALGLCFSGTAMADAAKAPTAQQTRMGDCNKQATGKKGDDRKAFMKACLSGQAPAADAAASAPPVDKNGKPLSAQQIKMKECAAQNKGKKGDDYKKAQSECLKK
jgi:hypothetical protein